MNTTNVIFNFIINFMATILCFSGYVMASGRISLPGIEHYPGKDIEDIILSQKVVCPCFLQRAVRPPWLV